jgi:DNA (cytosine-5)-methyltransferase 1
MDKILIDDTYASRNARQYTNVSPTLRSERFGFKVIEQRRESVGDAQPLKRRRTAEERRRRHLHGDKGATFSKGKESYIGNDGVANTVTTVFSKDNIIAEIMEKELQNKRYRIRKLTPRECFRLMDVCESDIDKIQASGVSESQQYKMAGNSIVVSVMALCFKNLFSEEQSEQVGQLSLF